MAGMLLPRTFLASIGGASGVIEFTIEKRMVCAKLSTYPLTPKRNCIRKSWTFLADVLMHSVFVPI